MTEIAAQPIVVVMGVTGSGKTTVGKALAGVLGCAFQEGDALHPDANIAKMRSGEPLDDADRAIWLDRVAEWIRNQWTDGRAGVISCSALKRSYRDRLRGTSDAIAFVFLDPSETVLRQRLTTRSDHFMPVSLLESQLATLEVPEQFERVLRETAPKDLDETCARICRWLTKTSGSGQ